MRTRIHVVGGVIGESTVLDREVVGLLFSLFVFGNNTT
jgi:hypothetical protein